LSGAESQLPRVTFLKEKPATKTPEAHRELSIASGRNSIYFTVLLGHAPVTEAFHKRPVALRAVHESGFSRVALQPQQPVVQALKKI